MTKYAYDAAGRLVKEGDKVYSYGWLDKIVNVQENGTMLASFDYHMSGQIAAATRNGKTENFFWDGLALIHRDGTNYVNEPYVTGGNPILADNKVLFNDMLGTTLGSKDGEKFSSIQRDAFGMLSSEQSTESESSDNFFTGKPFIGELGYAFLFRNYRAEQGKWLTADPLGYPDGWNNLAYCNNGVTDSIDYLGAWTESAHHDINSQWLANNGFSSTLNWGGININLLELMNESSDWTDSLANQGSSKAYLHAMRGDSEGTPENIAIASQRYDNYVNTKIANINSYMDSIKNNLEYGAIQTAAGTLAEAIKELGKLVHTLADSYSPSHTGFQYFSLEGSLEHLYAERYSVYSDNYRTTIINALNANLASLLRNLLRQPE